MSLEQTHNAQKAVISHLLARRAAVLYDDGTATLVNSSRARLYTYIHDKLGRSIKEVAVMSCVKGDEEQWAAQLEKTYGMVPLDKNSAYEKYPELFV